MKKILPINITIVIPYFNEEDNVKACVKNLKKQASQNYHVIFVDDGSSDSSTCLLKKELSASNIRFTYSIIHQKNSGAAKAREFGIKTAKTKYILTLDCDDLISSETIRNLDKEIMLEEIDIYLPLFKIQKKDNSYQTLDNSHLHNIISGKVALQNTLGKWLVPGVMCAKKEIFLKSYELYEEYNSNDINYMNNDEVISRLNFYHANQVKKDSFTYFYQNNLNSTTKKINPNRYMMAKNMLILYNLFGKDMGEISYNTRVEYINVLWGLIKYIKKNKAQLPNLSNWIHTVKDLHKTISPDKKLFKFRSIKMKTRYLLSNFYILFLKDH